MRAKERERLAAIELRRQGWALARIAAELGVTKSSVSNWVRDIPRGRPLPPGAIPLLPGCRLPVWSSGLARRCSRCRALLPDVCFNRHGGGRQWWCRACFRTYFRDRGQTHRDDVARAKAARRNHARRVLMDRLRSDGCLDCGTRDLVVLECDHVDGKSHAIATLVAEGAPAALLRAELARCEVVCANCHRRRTSQRAGWRRAQADWEEALADAPATQRRNLVLAYRHLEARGCTDCGEPDLVVLEFDHVGPKRGLVTRMASKGCSTATLEAEIAVCEVVCANCHRKRTAQRGRHHRTKVAPAVPAASYTSGAGR